MTSTTAAAYALADAIIAAGHRVHIDGDQRKVEVSVPFRGALYSDTYKTLERLAGEHGHTVVSDFANSAVRFIEQTAASA